MGLFSGLKITPEKMFKTYGKLLRSKDGNTHILLMVLPNNGPVTLNERVNAMIDAMRKHGYQIVGVYSNAIMGGQFLIQITYK